ncbi:NCS1 nucleoside transporter family protein-like protein [Clohesyomyces aquaticus]|uniref:NCS1 nucleoside transporter family protein-like protein n=1 Tax=Clohesyomyces aquaticus TaxID=1231657 RepID=A0A1Y1Z440_9PLEO|nr:NCS1 nucleoside transporter family protein-like protein [Clohesyomyces aquaticus]
MALKHRVVENIRLHGDEAQHEQTDSWSNRDLIPLPPSRRTWGWFHFFGFWAISSLNISNWQTPNTFLTRGLSVGQSMMIIVLGRLLIAMFSTLIAWCGLEWHIGFTVQNRYTWGMRASYIPLLQRILLNFIWNAVQCWNGGRLVAVCVTAIWPSFARIRNTLPASMPTTTYEFIGFVIFWFLSTPFLWIRPEKFKLPFQVISIYCGLGMLCWMIWALARAKGVGLLWDTEENIPAASGWNSSWLIMSGINQMLGGIAAGITNGSDFSRYAQGPKHYVAGTISSALVTGTMVSFVGLVTASACQKIYGQVYWNPPDLLMVMMDNGNGSSKSRAGVFFLSAGFALTGMFENICGNAVAGGIDLAGLFPRYIDIRRGAMITFVAAWVVQPWQLINRATTFIAVLSSFSVFLAPIIGLMACDYYILRKRKVRLSHLYRTEDSCYYFWHGLNWRAIPAWLCGWAPTVGGLVVNVRGDFNPPRALVQLYYMAFFIGFFTSATIFLILNKLFPVHDMDQYDDIDVYGTFTEAEARKLGVIRLDDSPGMAIDESVESVTVNDRRKEKF